MPFTYELIATFLLTGGREAEVLGLEVSDVEYRVAAWAARLGSRLEAPR